MTLYDAFKKNREERPHEAAFLVACGDRSLPITWRQFTDDIALVVHLIHKYAVGAKIGIIGENSYAWMVSHAAVMFAGTTVVPIDVNLSAEEISERAKFVGISVLVYSALYEEKAKAAKKLTPGLVIGSFGSRKTDAFLEVSKTALKVLGEKDVWETGVKYAETPMIVFTSGTTSKPRGAEHAIEGLEAMIEAWSKALPMKEGQRTLMLLPLHHIFGVCVAYLALCRGVALGVCPDFRRIYDAVERFRADFLFLVPALAEIFGRKLESRGASAEEVLGKPIEFIVTGGAPISRRTHDMLTTLGIKMLSAYGLTETLSHFSVSEYNDESCFGSAGKVSCDANTEVKVSEEGELLIKSPSVMKGYYKDPEKTAKAIDQDGFFHTGDSGRIDENGYVWITGRISRTIVLSSGKKIAPEELEEKLLGVPGFLEVLVSGDGEQREVKAEIYTLIPEETARRAVSQVNLTLPIYKRINKVVIRPAPFPRTTSGKIKVG